MCYECLHLPRKNWPFLWSFPFSKGENLEEKRFLKNCFSSGIFMKFGHFQGESSNFELEITNGKDSGILLRVHVDLARSIQHGGQVCVPLMVAPVSPFCYGCRMVYMDTAQRHL